MTTALLQALAKLGRGNPLNWRAGTDGPGGFPMNGEAKYCHYNIQRITLVTQAGAHHHYTAALCDVVAKKAQLTIF